MMSFYYSCIVCDKTIEGGMFCSLKHFEDFEKNKDKYKGKIFTDDGGTKSNGWSWHDGTIVDAHPEEDDISGWFGRDASPGAEDAEIFDRRMHEEDLSHAGIIARVKRIAMGGGE